MARTVRFEDGVPVLREAAPPAGEGLRLRVLAAGICGTDVATVAAGGSAVVPGHEVVAQDGTGTVYAVRPNLPCGACGDCAAGESQRCPESMARFLGVSLDGGFADEVVAPPSLLHPLPQGLAVEIGALSEPAAVALHAVRRLSPEPGERVLVVGGGTIGLLAAAELVALGHPVDVVARHAHQAALAAGLGARPRDKGELAASSYRWVLDSAGSQSAIDLSYEVGTPGARVVSVGALGWAVTTSGLALVKEIEVVPSVIYSEQDFTDAIAWLHEHAGLAAPLVTHRFPLSEVAAAFRTAAGRVRHASVKVLLHP